MTKEQIELFKKNSKKTKFYQLRLELSLSQEEIAKKLDITTSHWCNVELGKRLTSIQTLIKIKSLCHEHNVNFDLNELI